jgi:hypothetical protein
VKTLVLVPVAVAAALACAGGLCRLMGLPPHGRDLLTAAAVAAVAAEAALIPALLLRRSEPVKIAQAALGGTVLHLLLTIFLAAAVMVARVVEPAGPFVYWLTGAYWLSLALLVWALIGLARRSPVKAK